MRGRYYLKNTINRTVDNRSRNREKDAKYKQIVRKNAVDFIKSPNASIDEKISYLKKLTADCYRYGTKYKYDCRFSETEIKSIIMEVKDSNLYMRYFGKTIDEAVKEESKNKAIIGAVSIIGIILTILKLII
jgi:hypothetical protein